MSENINQFWNLLSSSGLIEPPVVENLVAESKTKKGLNRVSDLVQWLVGKNAVTQYQADVLANGQATNFLFGEYRLLHQMLATKTGEVYHAVHRSGQHVRLQFLPGAGQDDVRRWVQVEQRASRIADCQILNLATCFETVRLPQHRMVVSELPTGKPLVDLMPGRARLEFDQAVRLGLQLAQAVAELHRNQEPHRSICPAAIRLLASDSLRLDVDPFSIGDSWLEMQAEDVRESIERYQSPELNEADRSNASAFAADMYSIGALLFRMVDGRDICDLEVLERSQRLAKRDLPDWFVKAIENLTGDVPSLRMSADQLVDLLKQNGVELPRDDKEDARQGFRELITKSLSDADLEAEEFEFELEAPEFGGVKQVDLPVAVDVITADEALDRPDAGDRIAKAQASIQRRENLRWLQPIIVLSSCLVFGSLFAGLYYWGDQIAPRTPSEQPVAVVENGRAASTKKAIAARDAAVKKTDGFVPVVRQKIVQDDGETIWETPTLGPRLDLEYLPPAPKIILHFRPKQVLAMAEGQRLRKAMGDGIAAAVEQFSASIGMSIDELDEILISFHQDESEVYRWFAVVTGPSKTRRQLLDDWAELSQQKTIDGEPIYKTDAGLGFFLVSESDAPLDVGDGSPESTDASSELVAENEKANDGPVRFLVGPAALVKSVVDVGRGFPVAGSMQRLQEFSDHDRHLNLLYLRPSLFNDRGQNWMGTNLLEFNRQLSELLPDEVKGGLLSLHIDGGNYFEVVFDCSVDIKADSLKKELQEGIDLRLQSLFELNRRIPADDHWQAVQARYEKMIVESLSRVRWGVEDRELIGNAWLPPMAGHNLIAASELVAAFRLAAIDPSAQQADVPQDLAQLLQQKRDLDIANPPDLNVLMSDLQTEINADYNALPFKWRIVLLGADLEKDGITKNQRPGPLKLDQKSFAEILTSIVVSANPDKNISGPDDPACKLVWVVAADPDFPDQKAVLITTRGAAEEKAYQLPAPFVKE